jgi:pilus assembly protein CpaB
MKSMTWTVVGLVVLGLVAALCAAILFSMITYRTDRPTAAPTEIEVVQATKAIPAMTVIEADMVTTKRFPAADVPAGYFGNPVQVIGKALVTPMKADQVLTKTCFAPEGSGPQMAASMADDMCVVMLSLSQPDMIEGHLYPGSVVDVLATFDDPSASGGRGTVATTLLKGIQVVSVEGQTVFTSTAGTEKGPDRRSERRLVSLRMTPADAQAIQLAKTRGSVSLSLRNPVKRQPMEDKPLVLADLVHFSPAETPTSAAPTPTSPSVIKTLPSNGAVSPAKTDTAPPKWEILILRGTSRSTESFDMPLEKAKP